jgi:hypothetical protein
MLKMWPRSESCKGRTDGWLIDTRVHKAKMIFKKVQFSTILSSSSYLSESIFLFISHVRISVDLFFFKKRRAGAQAKNTEKSLRFTRRCFKLDRMHTRFQKCPFLEFDEIYVGRAFTKDTIIIKLDSGQLERNTKQN